MTRPRILIFGNVSQKPFSNNLVPVVRAFSALGECTVVEPRSYRGFRSTGGAARAPIPDDAVTDGLRATTPDIVVCLGGGLVPSAEGRTLLPTGAVTVGIALSDPLGLEASLEIAPAFDLFYTQDPQTVPVYRSHGIDVRRCDLAIDPEEVRPVDVPVECDVVFYGKWTPYRDEIISSLAKRFDVRVHAYPREDRWSVSTDPLLEDPEQLSAGLCASRLALELAYLDDAPEPYRGTHRITPRAFFAAACAVPSLVEAFDTLPEFFEPGAEVEAFTSIEDLVRRTHALLVDHDRRLEMGKRARARVLRDHTWIQRARQILIDARKAGRHSS